MIDQGPDPQSIQIATPEDSGVFHAISVESLSDGAAYCFQVGMVDPYRLNLVSYALKTIDGVQGRLGGEIQMASIWKMGGQCIVGESNVFIGGQHRV